MGITMKLRHAGPETLKCKPQREPALPAATCYAKKTCKPNHNGMAQSRNVSRRNATTRWLLASRGRIIKARHQRRHRRRTRGGTGHEYRVCHQKRNLSQPAHRREKPLGITNKAEDPTRFGKFSRLSRYCRLGIRDRTSDDKPLGFEQLDRQGIGTLKAISYRAYLQAAKRRSGPVWDFYQLSRRHTGSTTHARLNTQRKILLTLWSLWLSGTEFDPLKFSRAQPIDV